MTSKIVAPTPLRPPADPPPRWTRSELPPYRHVPGLTPHPIRHREGHLYGQVLEPWRGKAPLPARWRDCPPYLLGVDLFNRAFFWEAHESWEEIWHGVGRGSTVGHFVQGLIQCSAALLRHHLKTPAGASRLLEKATGHMARVRKERFMGMAPRAFLDSLAAYLEEESTEFPFLILEP